MLQIKVAVWLTILVERKMLEIHEEPFMLTAYIFQISIRALPSSWGDFGRKIFLPLPLDNTTSLTCIDLMSFFNG
jgi:hypothetical protein